MLLRGNYSGSTIYSEGDVVMYSDNVFYFLREGTSQGIPCTNTLYWQKVDQVLAGAAKMALDAVGLTQSGQQISTVFDTGTDYTTGEYVLYAGTLYRFTADHPAGDWTGEDVTSTNLGAEVIDLSRIMMLQEDVVPNTVQTLEYNSSGNVSQVIHKRNGSTIRTDAFTFGTNTVTEVRTLSSGESLTIITNTDTLVTTVTYAA